jgi:hypothetical protein
VIRGISRGPCGEEAVVAVGDVEVFHENGNWRVRIAGGEIKANLYETKDDAVEAAGQIAESFGVELIVRNLDGRIAERDSHGSEPRNVLG